MWIEFIANALVGAALLYVPGFFFFRALKFHPISAMCAAPLISIAFYAALPILLDPIGIHCSWTTVLLPTLAVSLICYAVSRYATSRNEPTRDNLAIFHPLENAPRFASIVPTNWLVVIVYLVCGVTVGLVLYVGNLGDPAAFKASNDNITHLNLIKAFFDSGRWSTLQTSNYLAAMPEAQASQSVGFYPAAWHAFAALLGSITQSAPTMLCNVSNALWTMIAYPLGVFLLLSALFPDKTKAVVAGALACVAFNAWPWWLMLKGPIYPAMASFILMLPAIAIALHLLQSETPRPVSSICITGGAAAIALALMQPSSLFAVVIFLVFPFALRIGKEAHRRFPELRCAKAGGILVALGATALFWIACFKAPFMQDVVQYEWKPLLSIPEAIDRALNLAAFGNMPQSLLVATTCIGAIAILWHRKNRWILLPLVYFITAFVFSIATGGFTKHFIGGFWYADPARLYSLMCIAAVPIAAMGIGSAIGLLYRLTQHKLSSKSATLLGAAALVAFCLANFYPSHSTDDGSQSTPFGYTAERFVASYGVGENRIYSTKEEAFVNEAMRAIPAGSLVINQPNDGSVFAYAVNNLNTYYRYIVPGTKETPEAIVIREKLDEIASNLEVQSAVASTGAQYVLLLDQGVPREDLVRFPRDRDESLWRGINNISDATPGFEAVLTEDDMRLYRITE